MGFVVFASSSSLGAVSFLRRFAFARAPGLLRCKVFDIRAIHEDMPADSYGTEPAAAHQPADRLA
jgi:hypothetical protein